MFILGDDSEFHGRQPWVTFSLVAINIVVFCAQCLLGDSFTLGFCMVPKEITTFTDLTRPEHVQAKIPAHVWHEKGKQRVEFRTVNITIPQAPGPFPIFLTLLTSMFLHGGWMHLIGNMWFLIVFGRNVECALGHGRFLAFYLACGVLGGLVFIATDPFSVIPSLGASGAISGVLGAYVAIHPLNPIKLWAGMFWGVIQLPAFVVVGVWFLFQYLGAFQSLEYAGSNMGGTAYWDHVGGFLAGLITIRAVVYVLNKRQAAKEAEEEQDQYLPENRTEELPDDPFNHFLPGRKVSK